ncbi:MAG: hypothetical protein V2G43_07550 [bacterium JZ-2024 1]
MEIPRTDKKFYHQKVEIPETRTKKFCQQKVEIPKNRDEKILPLSSYPQSGGIWLKEERKRGKGQKRETRELTGEKRNGSNSAQLPVFLYGGKKGGDGIK